MWRLLKIFLIASVIALAATWLADRPGEMVLSWFGHEIRMASSVAVLIFAVLVAAGVIIWQVVLRLRRGPRAVRQFFQERREDKGRLALQRSVMALAIGDAGQARSQAAIAARALHHPPVTLLLGAQAAELEGNEAKAQAYYQTMLDRPDIREVGLRGLFAQAGEQGNPVLALDYARMALNENPRAAWAANAVFDLEAAQEDWPAAQRTLEKAGRAKLIDRATVNRRRVVLLTALALALEKDHFDAACDKALQAIKLEPGFAPAAMIAARGLKAQGKLRRAERIIERAWRDMPYGGLGAIYLGLRGGEDDQKRIRRAHILAEQNVGHPESQMVIARAAIQAGLWEVARGALVRLLERRPTVRVCEMMAEIEEKSVGDKAQARYWLGQALRAPRDPMWVGEGYVSDQWSAVVPSNGEFDGLEWRVPVEVMSHFEVPQAALVELAPQVAAGAGAGSDGPDGLAEQAPPGAETGADKDDPEQVVRRFQAEDAADITILSYDVPDLERFSAAAPKSVPSVPPVSSVLSAPDPDPVVEPGDERDVLAEALPRAPDDPGPDDPVPR